MTRLRQLACGVWTLTKGYWGTEERWSARILLTSMIGLSLGLVGVNVLQNEANGALFIARVIAVDRTVGQSGRLIDRAVDLVGAGEPVRRAARR
jgi:ABC-type uncharacterized transport system fused permease/ATPase subunit